MKATAEEYAKNFENNNLLKINRKPKPHSHNNIKKQIFTTNYKFTIIELRK